MPILSIVVKNNLSNSKLSLALFIIAAVLFLFLAGSISGVLGPSTPGNFTGSCSGTTGYNSWDASPGAVQYIVIIDEVNPPEDGSYDFQYKTNTNVTWNGLSQGTTYYTRINAIDADNNWSSPARTSFTCTAAANPSPKGYHDSSDCTLSRGWACDESDYSKALDIDFYVDGPAGSGTYIGKGTANISAEQGVADNCGGYASHRFEFPTPDSIKTGANRSIYVYAVDIPDNLAYTLSNTPKTINCSLPTNTININSSLVTGITITDFYGKGFGGTTNYIKTSNDTISTRLDAPASFTSGGTTYNFSFASGCDNTDRFCDINVTGGRTQNVTFSYTTACPDTAPSSPSSPFPSSGATNISTTPTLSWTWGAWGTKCPTDDKRYYLWFGTDPTPDAGELMVSNQSAETASASYNPGTLSTNTTYYWQVAQQNAGTTYGPLWSFTTQGNTTLRVESSPVSGATITGTDPGTTPYTADDPGSTSITGTLTAGALSGYTFSSWSGCVTQSGNTCTVNWSDGVQHTVTANYTAAAVPTLSVNLAASPASGTAPLNGVDLTADVSGTATGTINYTFYCNRSDSGINITTPYDAKFDGVTTDPKTVADLCGYSSAGTYTAKVIVERGTALPVEARTTVTVTAALTSATKFPPCDSFGDIDLDGDVDLIDADNYVLHFVAGGVATAGQKQRADVDGNDIIELADAQKIKRYFQGLDATFPVCSLKPDTGPTIFFKTDPTMILPGQQTLLEWKTLNISSCTASGGWSGTKPTQGGEVMAPSLTTTYNLSCIGSAGSTTKSVVVTVTNQPPTLSFVANPSTITPGQKSTLEWNATYATFCQASDGFSGPRPFAGMEEEYPISTVTYTLTCTGPAGSITKSATINVTAAAVPTLSVNLAASPASGTAPLNGVDLTADVSGTATGTINYTFYCNRSDSGINITTPYDAKFDGVTTDPKTVADLCGYSSAGTYTAKVIVERGTALPVEARTTVTVVPPSACPATIVPQHLYKEQETDKIYVIADSCQKRWIIDPDAFNSCLYDWDSVEQSNQSVLNTVSSGSNVSGQPDCPLAPKKPPCSGTLTLRFSPSSTIEKGSSVTAIAEGFSNCSVKDSVHFKISLDGSTWSDLAPLCTLDTGSSCSSSFTANFNAGSYATIAFFDRDSDGSMDGNSGQPLLTVTEPPPPPPPPPGCPDKYTAGSGYGYAPGQRISDADMETVASQIFGSELPDNAKSALYYNVIPCESCWKPAAQAQGINCPAVGLYQLEESGGSCSENHYQHPWNCETPHAVDVYFNRGPAYWQAWYGCNNGCYSP